MNSFQSPRQAASCRQTDAEASFSVANCCNDDQRRSSNVGMAIRDILRPCLPASAWAFTRFEDIAPGRVFFWFSSNWTKMGWSCMERRLHNRSVNLSGALQIASLRRSCTEHQRRAGRGHPVDRW